MATASSTPQSSSALMRRWKSAAFLFLPHFLAFNQREGEKETKEGKDALKWRVVLSSTQWFIDPFGASPTFSSHHSGVNWTVFFCSDWRLMSAGYVFKLALIFPADWNYCFQSTLAFFRMIQFFECIQCLSWQVTSVKLNNLQCIVTTLSTKKTKGDDDKWRFCHLSQRLTKQHNPVQAWNRVWKEILCFKKDLVLQTECKERFSTVLWFRPLF